MNQEENTIILKNTINHLLKQNIDFTIQKVGDYLLNNRVAVKGKERLVLITLLAIADVKQNLNPTSNNEAYLIVYNLTKEILENPSYYTNVL